MGDLLDGVTDPVLRARIGILVAELEGSRRREAALRQLANKTTVLRIESGALNAPPRAQGAADGLDLTDQERNALQRAVADSTFRHWGWVSEPSGRVKSDAGQVVFPAGYVTAIQKVLEHTKK